MKGSPSLEDQRQAILARMQASREEYRRLLGGGTAHSAYAPLAHETSAAHAPLLNAEVQDVHRDGPAVYAYGDDLHSDGMGGTVSTYRETHHAYPASRAQDMRDMAHAALGSAAMVVKRHPLAVAAAVAALVAIGPRRALRGAVKGGTVVTALTLRNPKNIGMLTRLISTVADIVQRGRTRQPP